MYETFYGFREKPFHVTADPAFVYPSRHHQEAMAHLMYGIRERLGFIMITGEVGTGKTTLAKTLVQRLSGPIQTALVLNPALSGTQMLRVILKDFGAEEKPPPRSRGEAIAAIERFLLRLAESGGNGVLILDEAQAMSLASLEQVRLLSNVETAKVKLLQIVLLGQPELVHRLEEDERLRALRQRIAVRYQIQPLDEPEVAAYIRHRLEVAGLTGGSLFPPETVALIARASRGIPRRINWLCDQALVAGFVHEAKRIDAPLVEQVLGAAVPQLA